MLSSFQQIGGGNWDQLLGLGCIGPNLGGCIGPNLGGWIAAEVILSILFCVFGFFIF
jgi:hypothetical protein